MRSLAAITGSSQHEVAIVLGSGLSSVAENLVGGEAVPYGEVEGLVPPAVEGHAGALYWGRVGGTATLVFAGRIHLYEGHDARRVVAPIEAARVAGCRTIVLTNAAGAINTKLEVGAPCLISDHINLTGENPLRGPHDGRGPRFLDLSDIYDRDLRAAARRIDPTLQEGIYAGLVGPTYETPAEIRMLAALGADLVGMSTVLEAIQARYLGARVLGISVVTNSAAGLARGRLDHQEVAEAGRVASGRLETLLRALLES